MYRRQDLLEEAGFPEPPQTWDELKKQARAVQEAAGTRYGFVFQGADYEGGVVNALEYIWTSSGDVLDGNEVIVLVMCNIGTLLFGKVTGLLSSSVLALSAFHIQYSEEARVYGLLTL